MKLQYKTHLMISVVVIVVVLFISFAINNESKAFLQTQMASAAMDMSFTIAKMPEIGEALYHKDRTGTIQTLINPLIKETRYQYIIVMDMNGIQYSYPYVSGMYKPYKNGGEERVLNYGEAYNSADTNELLSTIRAFYPIYYQNEQVGAVLVGLLTDQIRKENEVHFRSLEIALVLGVMLGVVVAYFFSLNIKKSIFGLEPKEIAILLTEREMILQNIERGILAVNLEGKIIFNNLRAKQWIPMDENVEKPLLKEVAPPIYDLYISVIEKKKEIKNITCNLDDKQKVLLNMCSIQNPNEGIIGVIISLEDLTIARVLAEELTDYKCIVDSLRAQKHEFMNKLQVLSGLLQLEKYDEALDYIEEQTIRKQDIVSLMTDQIQDAKIVGLLLSKYECAWEKKVEFIIDNESEITGLPKTIDSSDVCTILGNLIDNSMEAMYESNPKKISVYISGSVKALEIVVTNTGPAIEEHDIFEKGYSTKGEQRGFGLYNVKQIIDAAHGKISWENAEEVIWHVYIEDGESISG